ncbi:ATP-dependent helicase [Muribaculum sp.]|uniref:ATP-dependent helicase n=1 Tax=Muribaculum sp. TaxID=1918611 RepID=UPI0023C0ACC9|nr:UvrD-helicase domain-containing protein [Muribaculum sp.]MDE5705956.1 UvrD-helicase domain-containing protein [Muribaculum sp.]
MTREDDYLLQLNDQQRDAVVYNDGPQLVIAGAGSGKTRVLTYKIVHLLRHGYEPWRILALTFTNKAAKEMRERIEQMVGEPVASRLWMGTFHSIFAKLLRLNADLIGFKSSFTIYDAADTKSLVKTILRDMELDDKVYKPATVIAAISNAKNALISPEMYMSDAGRMSADERAKRPALGDIYSVYCARCRHAGAMDFDDLLYYTNVLLRDNPEIRKKYQEYFRYVLVDEYQDTNFAQHVIIRQLCEESKALCVVGDDAQSIYSFRGANISNILNLHKSFPALRTFKLEQNYRSTQNIINAANTLIAKNKEQIPKQVFSRNDVGSRIEVIQAYSDYEEAILVANKVSQMQMRSHDPYNEFAILYRTNSQSRRLEESLRNRNIPYRIYGGLSFYQRKEVKDVVAYMRMAVNPDDDEAFKRVINTPARGIGDTTVNRLIHTAMHCGVSMWNVATSLDRYDTGLKSAAVKKVTGFVELVQKFVGMVTANVSANDVARSIVEDTRMLASLIHDNTPESISKQENILELLQGISEFVGERMEQAAQETTLVDFLTNVSLASDQDMSDSNGEAVTLMTVHAAKGLEFNNVIVVGVEEELFPSAMSCDTLRGIEEERRLLYVAITRARRHCVITYAASRYRNGQTAPTRPSRFIGDIDRGYLYVSPGSEFSRSDSVINPLDNYRDSVGGRMSDDRRRSFRHPLVDDAPAKSNIHPVNLSSPPAGDGNSPRTDGNTHDVAALKVGMRIEHSRFGVGTISAVTSNAPSPTITVMFNVVGEKKLLLKFARFTILDN